MTNNNQTPESAKYIKAGTKVPAGTYEHVWVIAAAWAETTVEELLADTETVRAVHYEAALRVNTALASWDAVQPVVAEKPLTTKAGIMEDLRSVAARMAGAAPLLPSNHNDAAEWASASADVYRVCRDISPLVSVRGL